MKMEMGLGREASFFPRAPQAGRFAVARSAHQHAFLNSSHPPASGIVKRTDGDGGAFTFHQPFLMSRSASNSRLSLSLALLFLCPLANQALSSDLTSSCRPIRPDPASFSFVLFPPLLLSLSIYLFSPSPLPFSTQSTCRPCIPRFLARSSISGAAPPPPHFFFLFQPLTNFFPHWTLSLKQDSTTSFPLFSYCPTHTRFKTDHQPETHTHFPLAKTPTSSLTHCPLTQTPSPTQASL